MVIHADFAGLPMHILWLWVWILHDFVHVDLISDGWRRLGDLVGVDATSVVVEWIGVEHAGQLVALSCHVMVVNIIFTAARCCATLVRIDATNTIVRVVDIMLLCPSSHFSHSLPRLHVAHYHTFSSFVLCHINHAAIVAANAELATFWCLSSISDVYVLSHNIRF